MKSYSLAFTQANYKPFILYGDKLVSASAGVKRPAYGRRAIICTTERMQPTGELVSSHSIAIILPLGLGAVSVTHCSGH